MTRTRGAVLVAAASVLGVLAVVPVVAPASAATPVVSVDVVTSRPTVGKQVVLAGRAPGHVRRPVVLQVRSTTRWVALARVRTGATGGYRLAAGLGAAGVKKVRVVAPRVKHHRAAVSRVVTLTLVPAPPPPPPRSPVNGCTPGTSATDPAADASAADLVAELDGWRADKVMAVGQQVNISSDDWQAPLTALAPHQVAVIGFDLDELRQAEARGKDPLADLITIAQQTGAVLTASWHARNPWTGGSAFDRTDHEHLADLLDTSTTAGATFWSMWDSEVAAPLARIRDAGLPVVLRPFHEAGGNWFWWGDPDPTTYRALWAMAQQRAATEDLQNVVWSYGAQLRNSSTIVDPLALLPVCVEIGGLDSYDPEVGDPTDRVDLTDYARLAAKVPFMTLSEVGPFGSDGSWDPSVITATLRAQKQYAGWAMLWFDDSDGKKQISSLDGGVAWLAGCESATGRPGFCSLR